MSFKIKDVIRNYYTGERWLLVDLGKGKKYISESKYHELRSKEVKEEAK